MIKKILQKKMTKKASKNESSSHYVRDFPNRKFLGHFFKEKKGMSQMWWIIATAVIAIIVVVLLIVWFKSSGGKLFENLDDTVGDLGDLDGDGVADIFDKCPCDSGIGEKFEGETKTCPNPKVKGKCPKLT